jgi:predicted AlkP superfamily phosphohydrolase/phosphomutase
VLPHELRYTVKRRMPMALQDRLTVFWRVGAPDWSRTRAFPVFADLTAYVRLNLAGREAEGCVDPADRVAILDEIAEALGDFRDADTGEPILGQARRSEEIYATGARHAWLPDLVLQWSGQPAARHRAIVSSRYGDVAWPTPGRHPTGRAGNHRPDGFLLASPGVAGRIDPSGGHIVDLAPTIWELMGLAPPPGYSGRSLVRSQREPAP